MFEIWNLRFEIYISMGTLYNDYNSYLKNRYGCKVYRIGLDAGFSCPNRDGTKGYGGCIYCDEAGSRAPYTNRSDPLEKQISSRIDYLKEKNDAKKFIAYFQAFTNTYAGVEKLKSIYDALLPFTDIVGLTIGTRPDTIDEDKIKLISSYKDRYDVWMEYGLQSSNDKTLEFLNRGHTYRDFTEAVELTKRYGLSICAHVILGLPGETKEDMMRTAERLNELRVDGVKIHMLHILKGSRLEKLYNEKRIYLLEQDEYVNLVCGFLENLSGDMVIQRMTGEGTRQSHMAPKWALDKIGTINKIGEALKQRGNCQGILVNSKSQASNHKQIPNRKH